MAKYQWSAATETVGQPPSGLELAYSGGGQAMSDWTIVSEVAASGGKALKLTQTNQLLRFLWIPGATGTGRIDVRGRFFAKGTASTLVPSIVASKVVEGSGVFGYLPYVNSSGRAYIYKATPSTASIMFTNQMTPLVDAWIRYRYTYDPAGATKHSLRVWREGVETEASTTFVITSNTVDALIDGTRLGIGGFPGDNGGLIDWVTFGTAGDDADLEPVAAGGTPPTGTVTIGTITPSTTSASVPYTYSAGDATGFQYRLDGGTATSLGASPATISGLTASTIYSIEVRATNADGEGAWSAAANFTTSAAPDTTVPTLTGVVTFTSVTQTSYTANWPAGLDNVAVTGYEYQIGSTAGAWTDAGNNLSAAITGRTAGATETVYVRNYDAAGLRSTPAISGEVTLLAATASVTSDEFKNNTGTLLASATIPRVWLIPFGTPDYTNLVTNGAGELVISEAGLSGDYLILTANADGTEVGVSKATAS